MKLNADIRSILKPEHLYGKRGDIVSIISDHGNVVCVEGKDRKRFAVNKIFLCEELEPEDPEPNEIAAPDTAALIVNKAPVSSSRKTKRVVPLNQPTIF